MEAKTGLMNWLTRRGAPWRPYPPPAPALADFDIDPEAVTSARLLAARSAIGRAVQGRGVRGRLRDLSFDVRSGEISYALVSLGGWLGVGARLVALPWSLMRFDPARKAYAVPVSPSDLRRARKITAVDLEALGVVRLPHRLRAALGRDDFCTPAY